jgi:hypothetical protein
MADVLKENDTQKEKPAPVAMKDKYLIDDTLHKHKVGLVELIMILLIAGIVFIFIFGMRQMKIEKQQERIAQAKVEQILPKFDLVTKAAKEYQAADPFAAFPLSIEEMNLPSDLNTPEFVFSFSEDGTVTATTTQAYGREGIKINYSIPEAIYELDDPAPDQKPRIAQDWLPE